MGDLNIQQTLSFQAAKNPAIAGSSFVEKEFLINGETIVIDSYNESAFSRFGLAISATDVAFPMGSVALGKVLVVKAVNDMKIKIVNAVGPSQLISFLAGKTSVIHAEFTSILLTNSSLTVVAKGAIYVAGD
jgi:hypothetical protein